jgi:hypothetical protein
MWELHVFLNLCQLNKVAGLKENFTTKICVELLSLSEGKWYIINNLY